MTSRRSTLSVSKSSQESEYSSAQRTHRFSTIQYEYQHSDSKGILLNSESLVVHASQINGHDGIESRTHPYQGNTVLYVIIDV